MYRSRIVPWLSKILRAPVMPETTRAVLVGCGGMSGACSVLVVNESTWISTSLAQGDVQWRLTWPGTNVKQVLKEAEPDVVFDVTVPGPIRGPMYSAAPWMARAR